MHELNLAAMVTSEHPPIAMDVVATVYESLNEKLLGFVLKIFGGAGSGKTYVPVKDTNGQSVEWRESTDSRVFNKHQENKRSKQ